MEDFGSTEGFNGPFDDCSTGDCVCRGIGEGWSEKEEIEWRCIPLQESLRECTTHGRYLRLPNIVGNCLLTLYLVVLYH